MRSWPVIGACAAFVPFVLAIPVGGCGSNTESGFGDGGLEGGSSSSGSGSGGGSGGGSGSGSGGTFGDSSTGSSGGGPTLIYAHTDSELYSMDPTSQQITDIGPFTGGGSSTPTITDLAVDGNDDIWVNSETAIYKATLPASGTGPVTITLQTQLPSGSKFYALGFTPAGTLESGESLIAGDSDGNLYYIDASGASSTPQELGGFGGNWELSGDVVFYSSGGTTIGLATIRDCSSSCNTKNDSLAEIDVSAMQAAFTNKTSSAPLLKQVLGSGTGVGDLFGIGAWGNSVYAFSRAASSGNPQAQLVQVGASGTGMSLQSFPNITSGWSGAGVSTKATITVVTQ
jgi:hypothetical protein